MYKDHKIKRLHVTLQKTNAYVGSYNGQTKWMYLLIKDDDLLNKYYTNWGKASTDINKNLIGNFSIINNF